MLIMNNITTSQVDAKSLEDHLNILIETEEANQPVFSFFMDLTDTSVARSQLQEQVASLRGGLSPEHRMALSQAEMALLDYWGKSISNESLGLAFFYRDGEKSFQLGIPFHVPLTSWATADASPNIVPLVELRDSYDRYIVMISTEEQARILEIVLGTVTREAWLQRPELRKRVGREWTREHYQNHQKDRRRRFLKEKIDLLEKLASKGGYSHLILAGSDKMVAAVREELPAKLRDSLLDVCNLQVNDPREKVVRETIGTFVEQEQKESNANLDRLQQTLLNGSGAVVGLDACERTINAGVVDTLLIAGMEKPGPGEVLKTHKHRVATGAFQTLEQRRENLVKLAVEMQCPIEFVERDSFLDDYNGIGAILRYRGAEHVALASS